MNKYRCQDSVRRKCDVGHCDGIYYGNDCECAKINDKAAEEPTATNFQHHFATLESAAEFLGQHMDCDYCPIGCKLPLDPEQICKDILLDWLSAPAEDE
ncbi:hypothetical protein [Ethanoligenens sp.]|uniref:hypothetical protein n=1 Tax=Ethanoligenens sp. TaxID=2099655 RepID=UPI0039ECCAD1